MLVALNALFPPNLARYRATSTEIRARDGSLLRAFTTEDGAWRLRTDAKDVEPHYIALLLAAEDQRFAALPGVDPLALLRASWQLARRGRIVSGGSTLTMQVARLLEPHRRGVRGKLHDISRAVQLELRYSKAEILGMYLTLAPFGGNIEGVRAASLAYFGTGPERLTDAQAALLVCLPQSPARRRPDRHPAAAMAARNRLLARLAKAGAISAERATEAEHASLGVGTRAFPRIAEAFAAGLARHAATGAILTSTIDPPIQRAVSALVQRRADAHTAVAVLVIDNATRAIRAYVSDGGGFLDLTHTQRSPGSALKPFIYGLAFDALMLHPDTVIDDGPFELAGYAPQNFDHAWHGQVTAREALQQSLNIPALRIIARVGPTRFVGRLRQAGAQIALPSRHAGLAVALGGLGIDLHDMAMLYTALANDGVVAPLRDEEDAPREPQGDRLITPLAAWYLQSILRQSPVPDGMAASEATGGRQIAFKTGTSYGFRDAWAMGYSTSFTVGVWVGRVEGSPRPGFYGRNTAAPLLFGIFGVLPVEPDSVLPRPADAIDVIRNDQLPAALRNFDRAKTEPGAWLAFPPDKSSIDYQQGANGTVTLRARGGALPLRWIVNGTPAAGGPARTLTWAPGGPGFVHVTIIDAQDRASAATFRILAPDPD